MEEQLAAVQKLQGQKVEQAKKELKDKADALASENRQALAKVKVLQQSQERDTTQLLILGLF